MNGKKVLVTGANGLLATNIIHALLASGYLVRGLLRRKSSYIGAASGNLELMEGDFTDISTVTEAMSGCHAVIHSAACTSQDAGEDEYMRVNVSATGQLLDAARRIGITKVVYISSANIFAYGSMESPGDETRAAIPPFTESGYARSKILAQETVRRNAKTMDITTLCPTFMIGPYDAKPGSGRIILMGYRKRFMPCPPGGKNFVPVQDVARTAVSAMEKPGSGEYLVTGENMSYRDFYRTLADCSGIRCITVTLPAWLLISAGKAGDLIRKISGIRTEISSVNMRMLCIGNYYSGQKACTELDARTRPVSDAINEAIGWFRMNGMVR